MSGLAKRNAASGRRENGTARNEVVVEKSKNNLDTESIAIVLPNSKKALPHALWRFGDCLPVSFTD
jgi:hypothetical protein